MELKKEGLELVYFNAAGRAESIRLALHHGSIPFRDLRINKEAFQKMKKENIFPFGQVPVLFIDGKPLGQSGAIIRYVAKKTKLYPTDPLLAAKVDSFVDFAEDVFYPIGITFHPSK